MWKKCGQFLDAESGFWLTASKETWFSVLQLKRMNPANKNELGGGFFLRASKRELSLADTFISAYGTVS